MALSNIVIYLFARVHLIYCISYDNASFWLVYYDVNTSILLWYMCMY